MPDHRLRPSGQNNSPISNELRHIDQFFDANDLTGTDIEAYEYANMARASHGMLAGGRGSRVLVRANWARPA
jgi:hypothetical protein